MSRIMDESICLDRDEIAGFFEKRASQFNVEPDLTAVLYQDVEVAEQRDAFARERVLPPLELASEERVPDVRCEVGGRAPGVADSVPVYHGIDPGLLPTARTDSSYESVDSCFCFDLDGTITGEELLPLIASEVGLEEEMRLLTRITMDGLIPFEESFRLRFAILRAAGIERIQQVVSEVEIDPDIERFIADHRERCFVITGNLDVWIAPLIERLGCRFYCSTSRRTAKGELELVDIMRKNVPTLELKSRFRRVVAVGDGYNDVPMFDVADVGVAFNGVHPSPEALVMVADYVALNGSGLCRLLNTL